ncbi:MAG: hypothetical protein KF689_09455 [Gemmatimonadaceae bacterium]|nr:hypothetical protein [Gemmatimonadaceae bacterium]MCW5826176.1 hypothetical protein [Gemmatimonadaceae bacterium]
MIRHSLRVAATLVAVVTASAGAQSPTEIVDRYNKAVDPQNRLASVQGMKSSMTMDIPDMGMSMTMNLVAALPNKVVIESELPGMGTLKQGFDGSTAWASDPMQGPRLLQGLEAASMAEGSALASMKRTPELFTAMEAAGTAGEGDDAATCVKFTWKSGRETVDCFSNASGLLVLTRTTQESPMGSVEVEAKLSDYRNVGGFMIAHRTESSMMGMRMVMVTTSVEFGPQPAALFELPAEIKALRP